MGMAVFTDTFIEVLDLTRTQLSIAYLIGTITSAMFLTAAGRLYDRVGARLITIGAAGLLALMLLLIVILDEVTFYLATWAGTSLAVWSFPAITLCYFGVRFAGQGVLTNASRNVLLVWFEKRRGLVSGARGVFVSLGFSVSPLIIAGMITDHGWRITLVIMAVVIGVGFTVLTAVFLRDTPESCGLLPDGALVIADENPNAKSLDFSIRLKEARRTTTFWIYSLGLAAYGLFITALTFHVVAIFEEAGRTSGDAFGYFLPQAIVGTCVNLFGSWLADSRPLKIFLVTLISGLLLGISGILFLEHWLGYWMMVLGFGVGAGLWGVISNLSFIRHFGRAHLGEITGLSLAVSVVASAIGPVLFSHGYDVFGTFHASVYISLCITAALLVVAISTKLTEPLAASRGSLR